MVLREKFRLGIMKCSSFASLYSLCISISESVILENMPEAKRQRLPSGDLGLQDINNLIRSKIEDVFKSQLDGLYRNIEANIRGKVSHIKMLENQIKTQRSDMSLIGQKISFLEKELLTKVSHNSDLEAKIKVLENREKNSPLQKELKSRNMEIKRLNKELAKKTQEILQLKDDTVLITKRDSFLKHIIVREMKRVKILEKEMEILEKEMEILKDNDTINKDIENELESLMNNDNIVDVGKTADTNHGDPPNRDDSIAEEEDDIADRDGEVEEKDDDLEEEQEDDHNFLEEDDGNTSQEDEDCDIPREELEDANISQEENNDGNISSLEECGGKTSEENVSEAHDSEEYNTVTEDEEENIGRDDEHEDLLEHDDGAQTASSYHPEDDVDTFSDDEDADDRISEAGDENSQEDGITENNEHHTDTELSLSENVPGIEKNNSDSHVDSSNMRIKDEPMEEEEEEEAAAQTPLSLPTLEVREPTPSELLMKETSLDELLANVESFLF